jgi:hypothetical protein
MIGLNPLRTKVLITTDEVIFHAPVETTPDARVLLQSIIIAESRFIKPLIGLTAYKKIVDLKNQVVTDANIAAMRTLLNENRDNDRKDITIQVGDYINSDTWLTEKQLALWKDHLHKITAECVMYCAMVNNRARFTAKGIVKNAPNIIGGGSGDTASVDLYELKHLMDKTMWHRIAPLINDMHTYMCTVKYPDYTRACDCGDITSELANRNGISLNMYDIDDDNCGCNFRW